MSESANDAESRRPLVQVRCVSKSFGGVHALSEVNLELRAGRVRALVGENGAGKSTLIKILSGVHPPDEGQVLVDGALLRLGRVTASESAGIAVIHQEPTVFGHLNAAENIFVGHEPRRFRFLLDRRTMRRRTTALLERLGERIDPTAPVGELPMAQRQMVAIARALSRRCRLLILDEPTASLSARETAALFRVIGQLRADGVGLLYVSHRLEEVFELADEVTVLRDGRVVANRAIGQVDRRSLIAMMVGRELGDSAPAPPGRPVGPAALEVAGLSRAGAFADVSFAVRAGEVVGLAGLVGAGRSELAQAIFGIGPRDAGEVLVRGRTLSAGSAPAAIAAGLALTPEDRQRFGLVLPMSVAENATLAIMRRLARWIVNSPARERAVTGRLAADLDIRAADPDAPVGNLSGGNQQKVVLGKWLACKPDVLILDEPTRGVDVAAKAEVHRRIRRLADDGKAVLLISSELPELLSICDRILVMRGGRIVGQLPASEASQEKLLALALPEDGASLPPLPGSERGGVRVESDRQVQRNCAGSGMTLPQPPPWEGGGEGRQHRAAHDHPSPLATPSPRGRRFSFPASCLARREYGILALLLLVIAAVAGRNPDFLAPGNLMEMLVNAAPAAIVACGLSLVVVTGQIDISVGSLMALLAAVLGLTSAAQHLGWPVPAAAALVLLLGLAVGLLNGLLVTFGRVPSIIVTLGMYTGLRGVGEMLMGGRSITPLPADLRFLGIGKLWGVPVCLAAAAAVIVATMVLVRWTALGRRVYAVGSNPQSARAAGLSPTRITLFVFALTGLLTAVATLVGVPRLDVIETSVGKGFELFVITCVVVGGTAISGGRGSIAGSLLAVLLLGAIGKFLIFLRLDIKYTYWQRAIQGAFILLAVLVDHLARRRRKEGPP